MSDLGKSTKLNTELTFDEKNHKYFLDGVCIPSVSEILSPLHSKVYGDINSYTLEIAAEKGTRVHRSIEFMSKYGLDKCDEDILGYVQAYKKFRSEHENWQLIGSELRLYNKALLYGMTIDEVYRVGENIVICDLKTTSSVHLGSWSVQLSAYKKGYLTHYPDRNVSELYIIRLKDNGSYELYKLEDNFRIFLACLSIYRFEV